MTDAGLIARTLKAAGNDHGAELQVGANTDPPAHDVDTVFD